MSNTIYIDVPDVIDALGIYTQIKVYKSTTTIDGTYVEITDSGTRIPLNNQDTLYTYVDSSGSSTDYYQTALFNPVGPVESAPMQNAFNTGLHIGQLLENMQVVITLDPSITDTSGNSIGNQQFFFTTTYNPLYSSVRKVRLEIGSFIQNLDDEAINFAIYEASLAADQLTWIKNNKHMHGWSESSTTSDFFIWARREWVTCTASQNLLSNVISGLKSKRLDNFSVDYDFIKRGQQMLDKVQACIDKWEKELKTGGLAIQTPTGFVKGELDPEDPHVGRMWEKGPWIPNSAGSNARYRPFHARRYIGGYKRNVPIINTYGWRKIQ
jgi:hypothetical protein